MVIGEKEIGAPQKVTIVTFRLGSQVYAFPITLVRQIIEMVKITPLPQVSQNVVGVINFHGTMVPVINLRCHLGVAEAPLKLHTPIILVNVLEKLVGLIVDQVLDVIDLAADQIIDPRIILTKEMGEVPILNGLIQVKEGTILLFNLEQLLKSQPSRAQLEATNTLAHSLEAASEAVSQSVEAPVVSPEPEEVVQNPIEKPLTRKTKARSRKKAGDTPKIVEEVVA